MLSRAKSFRRGRAAPAAARGRAPPPIFRLTTKSNVVGSADGKLGRFHAAEDLRNVAGRLQIIVADRCAIGHQASGLGIFAACRDRGQPVLDRECCEGLSRREEQSARRHDEARDAVASHRGQRRARNRWRFRSNSLSPRRQAIGRRLASPARPTAMTDCHDPPGWRGRCSKPPREAIAIVFR